MECPKCSYEWKNRISEPKACPSCKARLDRLRKIKMENGNDGEMEISAQ